MLGKDWGVIPAPLSFKFHLVLSGNNFQFTYKNIRPTFNRVQNKVVSNNYWPFPSR